jgi:hypothetical protein
MTPEESQPVEEKLKRTLQEVAKDRILRVQSAASEALVAWFGAKNAVHPPVEGEQAQDTPESVRKRPSTAGPKRVNQIVYEGFNVEVHEFTSHLLISRRNCRR